jgi:hypothetical protein
MACNVIRESFLHARAEWHGYFYFVGAVIDNHLTLTNMTKRYCRGCNHDVDDILFEGLKQCKKCREKASVRKRKSIICECGRKLLLCSLKVHLRSLYHADQMRQNLPPEQQRPPLKKKVSSQQASLVGMMKKLAATPL